MNFLLFLTSLVYLSVGITIDDWPQWRGPNRNAVASSDQIPPTQWNENTNVIWKAKVPGRGHSSPILVGNKIFLSTAEQSPPSQSVICFDKTSGQQLWQTTILTGGLNHQIHNNNTHASPTIVAKNGRMFVVFNNSESIFVAALDFDGKILWKQNAGRFVPKYPFGYGSSPCLHGDLVIAMSDCTPDGFLVAYNQADGKEVWRTKRGFTSSFATPIVTKINNQDQLLVSGSSLRAYDPKNGKELWDVSLPQWIVSCGTPVWLGDTVFVSGGFPKQGTYAVSASNQKIVWENRVKAYEQSLLAHDGYVYCHAERGVAYCWRASDGKQMWKQRATSGQVSASPVLVGDLIYMTGENGSTAVIKANPKEFELVAKNQLGAATFATPAIVDGRIYTRVDSQKGATPQYLYCIGEK